MIYAHVHIAYAQRRCARACAPIRVCATRAFRIYCALVFPASAHKRAIEFAATVLLPLVCRLFLFGSCSCCDTRNVAQLRALSHRAAKRCLVHAPLTVTATISKQRTHTE